MILTTSLSIVFSYCILLPDDAGKKDQDDGQEADPDGAHIERQCQPQQAQKRQKTWQGGVYEGGLTW